MTGRRHRFELESQELERAISTIRDKYSLTKVEERSSHYGLEVVFQNEVAGVRFEYSPRDQPGWYVIVGRLVDDKFPSHPGAIHESTVLTRFDLRDVAAFRIDRMGELAPKIIGLSPLSAEEACSTLDLCASDILSGDFSAFEALQRLVLDRLARSKWR